MQVVTIHLHTVSPGPVRQQPITEVLQLLRQVTAPSRSSATYSRPSSSLQSLHKAQQQSSREPVPTAAAPAEAVVPTVRQVDSSSSYSAPSRSSSSYSAPSRSSSPTAHPAEAAVLAARVGPVHQAEVQEVHHLQGDKLIISRPPLGPASININNNAMRRDSIIALLVVCTLGTLQAQNETQALRFSMHNPYGTARYAAQGGAIGALGSDLSAVQVNPAGLGFYRSSEFILYTILLLGKYYVQLYGKYG